jgi:hypothetical protein
VSVPFHDRHSLHHDMLVVVTRFFRLASGRALFAGTVVELTDAEMAEAGTSVMLKEKDQGPARADRMIHGEGLKRKSI